VRPDPKGSPTRYRCVESWVDRCAAMARMRRSGSVAPGYRNISSIRLRAAVLNGMAPSRAGAGKTMLDPRFLFLSRGHRGSGSSRAEVALFTAGP
jgi:hypothetical protein